MQADACWCRQLRPASSWSRQIIHTAQNLIPISTGQHLPVGLVQNSKYFWVCKFGGLCLGFLCLFPNTDAKMFGFVALVFFCSHVLPVCSGEWQEGYIGVWGFRLALQYCTRQRDKLCSACPGYAWKRTCSTQVSFAMPSFPLRWNKWLPNGLLITA